MTIFCVLLLATAAAAGVCNTPNNYPEGPYELDSNADGTITATEAKGWLESEWCFHDDRLMGNALELAGQLAGDQGLDLDEATSKMDEFKQLWSKQMESRRNFRSAMGAPALHPFSSTTQRKYNFTGCQDLEVNDRRCTSDDAYTHVCVNNDIGYCMGCGSAFEENCDDCSCTIKGWVIAVIVIAVLGGCVCTCGVVYFVFCKKNRARAGPAPANMAMGQPVHMGAPVAAPVQPTMMQVTVPQGMVPGNVFMVQTPDGRQVQVTVPQGAEGGMTLNIQA